MITTLWNNKIIYARRNYAKLFIIELNNGNPLTFTGEFVNGIHYFASGDIYNVGNNTIVPQTSPDITIRYIGTGNADGELDLDMKTLMIEYPVVAPATVQLDVPFNVTGSYVLLDGKIYVKASASGVPAVKVSTGDFVQCSGGTFSIPITLPSATFSVNSVVTISCHDYEEFGLNRSTTTDVVATITVDAMTKTPLDTNFTVSGTSNGSNVKIEGQKEDNSWVTLVASLAVNAGVYSKSDVQLTTVDGFVANGTFAIRVSDVDNPNGYAVSDIVTIATITLTTIDSITAGTAKTIGGNTNGAGGAVWTKLSGGNWVEELAGISVDAEAKTWTYDLTIATTGTYDIMVVDSGDASALALQENVTVASAFNLVSNRLYSTTHITDITRLTGPMALDTVAGVKNVMSSPNMGVPIYYAGGLVEGGLSSYLTGFGGNSATVGIIEGNYIFGMDYNSGNLVRITTSNSGLTTIYTTNWGYAQSLGCTCDDTYYYIINETSRIIYRIIRSNSTLDANWSLDVSAKFNAGGFFGTGYTNYTLTQFMGHITIMAYKGTYNDLAVLTYNLSDSSLTQEIKLTYPTNMDSNTIFGGHYNPTTKRLTACISDESRAVHIFVWKTADDV